MICRNCNHQLQHTLVDLYTSPPSNSYLIPEEIELKEIYYPLKAMVCDQCFLVQVDEFEKSENIFNQNYAYFSSYSKSWLEHSRSYAEKVIKRFKLNEKSFVVEIASNDGYLLTNFKEANIPCLGIEPSSSTASVARERGVPTIEKFFGEKFSKELIQTHGKADLMAANNVLAHVPNLHDFVAGFKQLLKEEGVATFEFPHLMHLVESIQFDTIYHEHFSYFSFTFVCSFFESHGLRIFDVEEIETHGGSLRIYVCHQEAHHPKENSVAKLLSLENDKGMNTLGYYKEFQNKVNEVKDNFLQFLLTAKKEKKKIAGYGAAAKGNTFINYAGIRNDLLPFTVDASPHKQGKFLPASRIPIYGPDKLKEYAPDYVIIFPWNIKKEIIAQLNKSLTKTRYVTFVPEVEIVDSQDGY